ncbi:hypothetical protein [Marinobacter sp. CA1]|uniref:hypothetical protein n=1 Tax=Marinobacter sp. CA1 TaxID=2817656 RepID=UPI001D0709CB|nr:hypothetical protein [Marinobacter sp. CA1]UDL07147.1 DUF872 domain-containing protein [Marinobacter sp. CA1]
MLKLEQRYFPFKKVVLTVNDDRELEFTSSSLSNSTTTSIPIDNLTSRPTTYRHLKVVTISAFLLSTALALISLYIMITTADSEDTGAKALVAFLVFGTFSFVSMVKLQGAYKNLLIFNDRRTSEGIIFLSPSKPSKKAVEEFVDELERKIKAIEYSNKLSKNEKVSIYLRHLKFLASEKVITEDELNTIVERLRRRSSASVVPIYN